MDGARQSEQRDALGPNVFLRGPRIQRGGPRSFGTGKPSEPSEPSLFPSPYSLYHVWPWEYPSERQPLTITCPAFPRPYCGTRASLFFFFSKSVQCRHCPRLPFSSYILRLCRFIFFVFILLCKDKEERCSVFSLSASSVSSCPLEKSREKKGPL